MVWLKQSIGIKKHGICLQITFKSIILIIKLLKMTDGVLVNSQHMQATSIFTKQSLVSLEMIYFLMVSAVSN